MSGKFEFEVGEGDCEVRLDKFLAEKFLPLKPEITRSKIHNLITEQQVFELSKQQKEIAVSPSQKTKLAQKFLVVIAAPKASHLVPKDIPFEIVFEDEDLLVINKPAGLTVHPGSGNQSDTLVNALLFSHQNKLSSVSGEFRPGIVHRLDKDTSGLMLVAKNDFTHLALSENLRERKIKRTYVAFVYGTLDPARGMINKNIKRSKSNRIKMAVSRSFGRAAITHYETKEVFLDGFVSAVECCLETGRTHQIRVHLESQKHSLVGDQLYNSCKKYAPKEVDSELKNLVENFPRQALHSYKISFLHPRSQELMNFEIGLPKDLKKLYESLKNG